ncbi:MAG: cupredoxin domain-containing protein [Euryarchaeota archaeon]|nr:cupredoxin domain-containing protein [Euryarchaeota archaeon]
MKTQPSNATTLRLTAAFGLLLAVVAAGCTAAPAPGTAAAGQNTVKLVNMRFEPSELTVKAGTAVEWANQDSMPHDVTGKDKAWQSTGGAGGLAKGATFSKTFDVPGVYEYYCMLHSSGPGNGMSGKIIVQ